MDRPPPKPCDLLAAIPKPGGKREAEIRVTRSRGRFWRYDVRVWVRDDDGLMRPTLRGVTFAEDKLASVRDALIEACKRAGLDD